MVNQTEIKDEKIEHAKDSEVIEGSVDKGTEEKSGDSALTDEPNFDSPKEEMSDDHPQFSVDTDDSDNIPTKNKTGYSGVLMLACACVIGAIGYSYMGAGTPPIKSETASISSNDESATKFDIDTFEPTTNIDDSSYTFDHNQNGVAIGDVARPKDTELGNIKVSGGIDNQNSYADVNIAILDKLTGLETKLDNALKEVATLKGLNMRAERVMGEKISLVTNMISSINKSLENADADGSSRDKALSNIMAAVSGFKVDIQTQRTAFDFNILHAEYWGGKIRLIGYNSGAPETLLKIYENQNLGMWTLTSITNSKAIFTHRDGHTHEEQVHI